MDDNTDEVENDFRFSDQPRLASSRLGERGRQAGAVDVLRTYLMNRRRRWSPKITLLRFMDVLRTCEVSAGAQTKEGGRLGLLMSFGHTYK
jgi:hypothetical protein